MATRTPKTTARDRGLAAGVAAFKKLLADIEALAEPPGDLDDLTVEQVDALRDYRGVADRIERAFAENLGDDPARREGFLRALTDTLVMYVEAAGDTSPSWDPLKVTAASYAQQH